MQSTLEHFTIKKAFLVYATGGNSSALFFCGVTRWGMWGVCGVYDEPACHVCIYGHALQSNMAHANSQTNQTGWLWSHRFLCRTPDVAANDKCRQSTLIQTVTSYIVHIPHLPTPHHTPLPISTLPLTNCLCSPICLPHVSSHQTIQRSLLALPH